MSIKIDIAYGKDLDDDILIQLQYMEVDAVNYYDSLNSENKIDGIIIGIIPTETLCHFKRRVANELFFMKIKKTKKKKQLLGMACLSKYKKNIKYLHTVFVRKLYRRKGIGEALIRKALAEAKKMKCSVRLNVNPLNYNAIQLYKKVGFEICKEQKLDMQALTKFRK